MSWLKKALADERTTLSWYARLDCGVESESARQCRQRIGAILRKIKKLEQSEGKE